MISLVIVPNKYPYVSSKSPPIGLGYISAYLKSKGIDSNIWDFDLFPISLQKSVSLILETKPEVVGFTCYSQNYFIIRKFCELLKKRDPNVKTVVGGPAPTFAYEDILNDTPHIDFCVRGEGEITLEEIYRNNGSSIDNFIDIKGIAYKSKDIIEITPKRQLISNLDDIPSPYLNDVFDLRYYNQANISTSRGCPMKCIYCTCGAMFGYVRFHSPKRVLDEIDHIYELNEKIKWSGKKLRFNFTDDTFTFYKKNADKILSGLEERKYNLSWSATTRITSIEKTLLARMKKLGLEMINFGLESADPFILKVLNKLPSKGNNLDQEKEFVGKFDEIVEYCRDLGIEVYISYIIGNPYEDKEKARKTINFCLEMERNYNAKYIPNILVPFKGTNIANNLEKYNMKIEKDPEFMLPYFIKKYSAIDVDELIEIFPYNHRFFISDEIYNRSLMQFDKLNKDNFYKSSIKFRKFLQEKLLKK